MRSVLVATLLLLGLCSAARLQPVSQVDSQSLHPDWITPEEKPLGMHAPSAEQSGLESPASLLEMQARTKAAVAAEAQTGEGDAPSWILPLAPAGYGGPGVINPYSNVNPLNPMAAQMQAEAAGQFKAGTPQSQMGPAQNNNAPVQPSFLEVESKTAEKRPVIESAEIRVPWAEGAAFAPPPFMAFPGAAMERGLPTSLRLPFPMAGMFPMPMGLKGPVVEKMDISFTVPRSGDDFNWPVVNGLVREHIEITKVPSESDSQAEEESPAPLANNMLTSMLRELTSSTSAPAKLEVVELPSNSNPLNGLLQALPAIFGNGAFTVEPELRDVETEEEEEEEEPSEQQPQQQQQQAEHPEPAATEAAPTEEVIAASPTEAVPESPAPTEETAATATEPVSSESSSAEASQPSVSVSINIPPQLESEASALLNALLSSKLEEAVEQVNQELDPASAASSHSGALKSKP